MSARTHVARLAGSDVRRTLLAALASLLGAITLKGLLRDYGWLVDVAITIAVVAAPAALLRLRRPSSALDIWPGVMLMVPWLTARFLGEHALLGFIPTGSTLHALANLMTQLHETTREEVAPIHSTPAVRLVLCALIGLLAALVDLIAVVGRRGALAGIPLLVIYTVSGAVPREAVAWPYFVAAAFGFLILLSLDASDDRALWGHRIADPDTSRSRSVVNRTAPRLAVAAVAVAVVVPLLVPVQGANLLADAFHHSNGDGDRGFGASDGGGGSISPFAKLRDQLVRGTPRDMATVRITGAGSTVPFYLRVNVLDRYVENKGWTVSDHGSTEDIGSSQLDADPAEAQVDSAQFQARITVSGLTGNAPIFGRLTAVEGEAGMTWSSQDQLLLGKDVRKGQTITEQISQPTPTVAQLSAASNRFGPDVSRWLVKPALPKKVTDLVQRLTGNAAGPYAAARAISDYFAKPSNGFTYSTQVPVGDSGSQLVDFLQVKQGFCQQYAAAMAIMLRQAGVPSRVVLGYMHSAPDRTGRFTVTSNDAHAWVEAYFAGVGWIPFDPTPTAGLSGGAKSDLAWAPHAYPKNDTSATAAPSTARNGATSAVRPPAAQPSTSVGATSTSAGSDSVLPLVSVLGAVLIVVILALLPAGVRAARRRRRMAAARHGDTGALWAELSDSATDLGYVWSAARSPRQVAEWLGRDADGSRDALESIALAVERSTYGSAVGVAAPAPELAEGLRALTHELSARRSLRTRLSSRLWPASLGWGPRRVQRAVSGLRRH